jgi:hypothetical protein
MTFLDRMLSRLKRSVPFSDPLDVFISYSSQDRSKVLEIESYLKGEGITAWLDRDFIDGGENYGPAIVNGIRRSGALLLMCSAASMRSRNVRQEIMLAWKYEKPYLPLLIDDYLLSIKGYPEQVAYWLEGNQWIEVLDAPPSAWLPAVVTSLQKVGEGGHLIDTGTPTPIVPRADLRGLLSIARFSDQIWPVPAEQVRQAMTRSGYRDLGAPQEEVCRSFRRGDGVAIIIEPEMEGYLTLLDIGTSGKIYSLCPSRFAPDTRVHAGRNEYPQRGAAYRSFAVTGKPGREQILAIISRDPIEMDLMPERPEAPARVLTPAEIEAVVGRLRERESSEWVAISSYFDVV